MKKKQRIVNRHVPGWPRFRFSTLEDALKWHIDGIGEGVPSHIQDGNRIVPNPAYHDAPYEGTIIWEQ